MIDEPLLDDPDALMRADSHGLLRAVAASGACVRTAAREAEAAGLADLRPEGKPATVMVAGTGIGTSLAAHLLDALSDGAVRVNELRPSGALAAAGAQYWRLPRWSGPLDLLLLLSEDGSEPGLTRLLEDAYRRGCTVAVVAPRFSPLAQAAAHRRSLAMPLVSAPHLEPVTHPAAPGPYWSQVTPLLLLGGRLGLFAADVHALESMADRLDAVAESCGPATAPHGNPAKTLAIECADALPLLWSEGRLADAAARHAAATLTGLAGVPALASALPLALTSHGALLTAGGTGDTHDFFRDRVEEPAGLRPHIILLCDAPDAPDTAATAARDLAAGQGTPLSKWESASNSGPLETIADYLARLDFTAVYLTVA